MSLNRSCSGWLLLKLTWSYACQSLVLTMWSNFGLFLSSLMAGIMSREPVTARLPPWQKSFYMSTMISADLP